MIVRLIAPLSAALVLAFPGSACEAPPVSARLSPDALIDETDRIVLVEYTPLVESDGASHEEVARRIRAQDAAKRAIEGRGGGDRVVTAMGIARLQVLEVLKGSEQPPFVFAPSAASPNALENVAMDFDQHRDDAFWSEPLQGRGALTTACRFEAAFEPGERYVMFVGAAHAKAAERIASEDDRWLAYVRERTSGNRE